ncbi:MAG: radical SAM protein [Desulfovibrio sp.]|uniref:radical SAM protein n=1 Tax=Desulfovibrio sp. 7SRBS1 TaxID=3378064 RepID=UPI003B41841A
MFFKRKSNVLFRKYSQFGYITDNRNFGYNTNDANEKYIGDKILSQSGTIFFSALDKDPQPFEKIVSKISKQFTTVNIQTIKNDALDFYSLLECDGFIVSGKTRQICEGKDTRFSYKKSKPTSSLQTNKSSNTLLPSKSTQDFLEEHFKGSPQLTSLHIEITSRCNERCIHCYIPHENKLENIKNNLFYSIIEQCKRMNVLHLTLSGGEPMLHENFCDFLEACRTYNFSVNVLSNLTLLDDKIIKELKANPLLGVQVSLYSMNPVIHDEITRLKGSFYKTKMSILKLVENNIPLQISCPIMKQNKNSYEEVIKWAEKNNIHVGDDYVIIARYNHSIKNLNCRLTVDEVKEILDTKAAKDSRFVEEIELEAAKKKNITPNDFVCSVCNSSICIAENGNVYPCAGWQDYIVGNVNGESLKDIWNNSKRIQYLRELRNSDFPKCIRCTDREFCTMCMVRNANESPKGNPLEVNEYFCKIAKLNKKLLNKSKTL